MGLASRRQVCLGNYFEHNPARTWSREQPNVAKEENVKPDARRGIAEQHFTSTAYLVTAMAVRYSRLYVLAGVSEASSSNMYTVHCVPPIIGY